MSSKMIFQRAAFLSLAAMVSFQSLSSAAMAAIDSQTMQAISLFKDGKLQQAVDVAEKATSAQPQNWLSHATLSYLYWQEGNVPDAIDEGQKSVRYAPHNAVALINLADVYQLLGNYQDALPLYEEARKADANNWIAWVCLARCYIGADRPDDALRTLKDMSSISSKNFAWHFQLGETYLTIDKPGLAVEPLSKAVSCATMPEQKSAALSDLLVALIRDNKLQRATSVEKQSIDSNHPKSSEPYVRVAATMLSPEQPARGKEILQIASNSLESTADFEAFFRLGRIFEEKADAIASDTTLRNAWLDNAEAAMRKAIELSRGPSKNHVALAAILERKGKFAQALLELSQANKFDQFDPLGPFLSSRFAGRDGTLRQLSDSNIVAVDFEATGLTCGCQATRIDGALKSFDNVAAVKFSHIKPYTGTILVDQSTMSVDQVFARCGELVFPATPALKEPPPVIKYSVISQTPVHNVDEAVKLSQHVQYGSLVDFPRHFDAILPELPVQMLADKSHAQL